MSQPMIFGVWQIGGVNQMIGGNASSTPPPPPIPARNRPQPPASVRVAVVDEDKTD